MGTGGRGAAASGLRRPRGTATKNATAATVGADGPASRVRAQLLPRATPVDARVAGIAHKVWLDDDGTRAELGRLATGMNAVQPNGPCFLFTSVFEPPAATGARPYLLCALMTRAELLPPDVTGRPTGVGAQPGADSRMTIGTDP